MGTSLLSPVPSPVNVCTCAGSRFPFLAPWGKGPRQHENKMTHCKGHSRTAPPGTCRFQDRGQERRQSRPPPHTGSGYYTYRQRREKGLRKMDLDTEGSRVRRQTYSSKWKGAVEQADWRAGLLPVGLLSHSCLRRPAASTARKITESLQRTP